MKVQTFEAEREKYQHWQFSVNGDIATLSMDIQEEQEGKDYLLKLNSYDIFVDIELADALNRLCFEYPQVRCVVVTSAKDRVFCAGANIPMLAYSPHAFKVNFCKFTNETRLYMEEISGMGGPKFLAALNGVASGGGYELAIACDEIILVDDRSSAVSLPEVPLLGVLPGTGGLTRVVDKRKIRRDIADYFSTVAEGVRGKRAVDWRLVDATYRLSQFNEKVAEHARKLADQVVAGSQNGIKWAPLQVEETSTGRHYQWVKLNLQSGRRTANLEIQIPDQVGASSAQEIEQLGTSWWMLDLFRSLEDAIYHLRFNHLDINTICFTSKGNMDVILQADALLEDNRDHWLIHRIRHYIRRVFKKIDVSSKTLFTLIDQNSAFAGTFFELIAIADRSFMLDEDEVSVRLSTMNFGAYPMANGLSRLEARFYGEPENYENAKTLIGQTVSTQEAMAAGLVTFTPDDIDWEDEIRIAIEERSSFSPDSLTGMEANLRFVGPESMETKIFGRLSAWQNWIFQRPNAVGENGALKSFGSSTRAKFNYDRT
jgi:benzoyl-CoA-dihydrodiol lyase